MSDELKDQMPMRTGLAIHIATRLAGDAVASLMALVTMNRKAGTMAVIDPRDGSAIKKIAGLLNDLVEEYDL